MDRPPILHGVYPARRAAALAGMPLSTLHYWARNGIVVPRASKGRPKLWSYEDLMALRAVVWLRREKQTDGGVIRRSSMPKVRSAIDALRALALDVWDHEAGSRLVVDVEGQVFLETAAGLETPAGQFVAGTIDVIEPFEAFGRKGPNLLRPRRSLQIIPGKLGGAPHIASTRIETEALAALHVRGFTVDDIAQFYPAVDRAAIIDALDLEAELGTVGAGLAA